jgi:hypothetical protein
MTQLILRWYLFSISESLLSDHESHFFNMRGSWYVFQISSDIFALGSEQQKIPGPEFDLTGCWYCSGRLRYVILFCQFLRKINLAHMKHNFSQKKRKKHNLQSRWNYHINSIHAFTTSSSIAAEFFTLQKGHLIFVGVGVLVYQFALYPYIVKYFGSIRPLRPVTVCETHLCKIRFSTPLVKMIKNLKQIKLV